MIFFVGRGISQSKNVVFVSMCTPSWLAHKIPYINPFSSLQLVLPFHTCVVPVSSLTAVSLFSHSPYRLFKYFRLSWCIEPDSLTRSSVFFVLEWLFLPPFFPCWGFFRSPILEPGQQVKIFNFWLQPFLGPLLHKTNLHSAFCRAEMNTTFSLTNEHCLIERIIEYVH